MILSRSQAVERRNGRRGAAAVELALLLPVLIFWSMIAVDFARVAYVQVDTSKLRTQRCSYEFYTKAASPSRPDGPVCRRRSRPTKAA